MENVGLFVHKLLSRFASEEEKRKITSLVYEFADKTAVEVECKNDLSECYYEAQKRIADAWNEFERSTGLFVDRMEEHCRGWSGEYYGVFKSLEDGCRPLAVLKEVVDVCCNCLKLRYVPLEWYI